MCVPERSGREARHRLASHRRIPLRVSPPASDANAVPGGVRQRELAHTWVVRATRKRFDRANGVEARGIERPLLSRCAVRSVPAEEHGRTTGSRPAADFSARWTSRLPLGSAPIACTATRGMRRVRQAHLHPAHRHHEPRRHRRARRDRARVPGVTRQRPEVRAAARTYTGAAALMMRPMCSGSKNSTGDTVPAVTLTKESIASRLP